MPKKFRAWFSAIVGAVLGSSLAIGGLWGLVAGLRDPRPPAAGPNLPVDTGTGPLLLYLGLLLAPFGAALGGAYGWRLGAGLGWRLPNSEETIGDDGRQSTLIIGYGNTLRRDDGAGYRIAEHVAAWDRPDVTAIAVHQLVPELSDAISNADRVIFVDARPASEGDRVDAREIAPAAEITSPPVGAHVGGPEVLLALARSTFGRAPATSWMITVPGVDFEFGESLSPTAERGSAAALEIIARLIEIGPRSTL